MGPTQAGGDPVGGDWATTKACACARAPVGNETARRHTRLSEVGEGGRVVAEPAEHGWSLSRSLQPSRITAPVSSSSGTVWALIICSEQPPVESGVARAIRGVDVDRFVGRRLIPPYDGSRPLRLLFVGQMRPHEGIAEILQATAGQACLQLTVVGKGRLVDHDRAMASSSNTVFAGSVSDGELTRLYLSHDVVVKASTSRLEAFGLGFLEGMAAACVPVASDLPGIRDVAAPTGRVVPAGDVEALRTELIDLARNPGLVREPQARSRAHAARYSWAATGEAYEQAFLNPLPATIDLTKRQGIPEPAGV